MSRGAVYITLRRLERKGLLKSHLGEPTGERGGRARRYFQVEREAVQLLRDSRRGLFEMWRGLEGTLNR
jgi:DNA-binding PadR family transcriptional regulator